MFVGSGGTFCTGTMIVRDLVLTATGSSRPVPIVNPLSKAVAAIADVALMKLKTPHPGYIAPLFPPRPRVAVGERFVVRGYGATIRGNGTAPVACGRQRFRTQRRGQIFLSSPLHERLSVTPPPRNCATGRL
jgi:hypothetical protein